MSKEITTHDSRRVYSDKHFTLITVNQTTQIFERSTLYYWLYHCITSAKSRTQNNIHNDTLSAILKSTKE